MSASDDACVPQSSTGDPRPSPRCSEDGGENCKVQPCGHPQYESNGFILYVKVVMGTKLWDSYCYLIGEINKQNPVGISPGDAPVVRISGVEYRIYRERRYIQEMCKRHGLKDPQIVSKIRVIDRVILPLFDPSSFTYCNIQGELIIAWEKSPLINFDYLSSLEPVRCLPLFPKTERCPYLPVNGIFGTSLEYNPLDPLIIYNEEIEGSRNLYLLINFLLPYLRSFFTLCSWDQIFYGVRYEDVASDVTAGDDLVKFIFDLEDAILHIKNFNGSYEINEEAKEFKKIIKRGALIEFIRKLVHKMYFVKSKYATINNDVLKSIQSSGFQFRCTNQGCKARGTRILYPYLLLDDSGCGHRNKGIDLSNAHVLCLKCRKPINMRDVFSLPSGPFLCFINYEFEESDVYLDGLVPSLSGDEEFGPFFIQSFLTESELFIRCANRVYPQNEAGCIYHCPSFAKQHYHTEGNRHDFRPLERCSAFPDHPKGRRKIGCCLLSPAIYHEGYSLAHQILSQKDGTSYFSTEERMAKNTDEMTDDEKKLAEVAKLILSKGYYDLFSDPIDVEKYEIDRHFLRKLLEERSYLDYEKLYGLSSDMPDEILDDIFKTFSISDCVSAGVIALGVILFVKGKMGYLLEQCDVFTKQSKRQGFYPISENCAYTIDRRGTGILGLDEIVKTNPGIKTFVYTQHGSFHYWQWLIEILQDKTCRITLLDSLALNHSKQSKKSLFSEISDKVRSVFGIETIQTKNVQLTQSGCNCAFFCILHTLHVAYPDIITVKHLTNHELIKRLRRNLSIIMAARVLRLIDPL